jgi:hypothetical protein
VGAVEVDRQAVLGGRAREFFVDLHDLEASE